MPVTDLLKVAKPIRRPTEQRANPNKRRELKKAADEVRFVFIDVCPFPFLGKIFGLVAEYFWECRFLTADCADVTDGRDNSNRR